MASTLELIFAFFSVGIFVGAFLLFIKKYRKLGLRLLLASTVVSFGVFSMQEYQKNQHAKELGFLDGDDWQAAVEAGIENPQDWAVELATGLPSLSVTKLSSTLSCASRT